MGKVGVDNEAFTVEDSSYPGESTLSFGSASKKWSTCHVILLVFTMLMALFGCAMMSGGYDAMFDAILKSQLQVTDGSYAYEIWRLTPVPLFLRLYFFNLTNPDEFVKGAKPIVQQVGPYCYREYHEKQNLTFHANHTVTFFQERWWIWDQELSGNNSREDIITIVNAIPISAAWSVRKFSPALTSLNGIFNLLDEQLIVRATAGEIMFDGFQDPLLDWMQDNVVSENATLHNLTSLLPPGLTDYDKFGWFYGRNLSLTYDGEFTMMTGEDSLDNLGKIDLWNKRRETNFFDPPCNYVTGSAGEMWPPNLKKDFVDFYSSDLCMSMKLFYKEDQTTSNGLNGYRYWGTNHTFANDSTVPGNQCYCVAGTCAPMGLLNAESCRMGAPAFISFPHFLHADPFLFDQVDGMEPDEDKHAFMMDIIPELGTPMHVSARMQINMRVIPYKGEGILHLGKIDILEDVPDVYLPMLWFEEIADIPNDMASQLKALLFIMKTPTIDIFLSLMTFLGALSAGVIMGVSCGWCRR